MDRETEILSRLAANHLYLVQFEPLRAVLQVLRSVNEDLSRSILQTIVSRSGRFDEILFPPSGACSSPVAIAYLSALELLQYPNPTGGAWSFDSIELKARAEFLFLIQELINKTGEGSCPLLEKLLELGVVRLKSDVDFHVCIRKSCEVSVEEEDVMTIKDSVLENPEMFDALCVNMRQQTARMRANVKNSVLTMSVTSSNQDEEIRDDYETQMSKAFYLVLNTVQLVHLDAMNFCLSKADDLGAIRHVRYFQPDFEVIDTDYRKVLQKFLLDLFAEGVGYGNFWCAGQEKILMMYQEALSSKNNRLVFMIQDVQDGLLSQLPGSADIIRPLDYLLRSLEKSPEPDLMIESPTEHVSLRACLRDLYHYARVSRTHIFEVLMKAALHAVRRGNFHEANNVLVLYPRLRALVAAMGWDILSSNTIARRRLMYLLWSRNRSHWSSVEESYVNSYKPDEISCVDHLCNTLCYDLDLSSFAACVNSGQIWDPKSSLLYPGNEEIYELENPLTDSFVENFVLERLAVQSPLKVLFDVVPTIKFRDAVELIGIQPTFSAQEKQKRAQNIELIHMRFGLQAFVLALGFLEKSLNEERVVCGHSAICYLNDLRTHFEAIESMPRKIFMVNIIISLLHMDNVATHSTSIISDGSINEMPLMCSSDHNDAISNDGGNETIISFVGLLLQILRQGIMSLKTSSHDVDSTLNMSIKQSLDWRTTLSKNFIEDWQWRLSLLPLMDRQWKWKESLTILRAAPPKLLTLCMQKAKYDIGVEAVERFSLSAEDEATLKISEYVDSAFERASESKAENAVSRAVNESTSLQDSHISSICSQLGPLASILLCIDVAVASARSAAMSKQFLDQGQSILSLIYPGGYPKLDATYWDQILEVGIISVLRRILKRLNELLEQDDKISIQETMVGESLHLVSRNIIGQGAKDRASATLVQMIEDAYKGKRQFLSGKLHNLARAIADEESSLDLLSEVEKDRVVGIGLRVANHTNSVVANADPVEILIDPISSKPATYLSQFILYIAAIGDIVDGTDTTHDFNYFSVIYEWPKDLLTRLVFDRGSSDAAGKAADIMHADFVHEIISACVPPVYPARSGNGWACIPYIPSYSKTSLGSKTFSPAPKDAKPNCYNHSSALPVILLYPPQLDIMKHLVNISPVRAVLACVFGSGILYSNSDSAISSAVNDSLLRGPDGERLFYEFALDQSERFPTLNRWIQMQTNLHRVSEFAVEPDKKFSTRDVQHDDRVTVKRLREPHGDSEPELDERVDENDSMTSLSNFDCPSSLLRKNSAESIAGEFDSLSYLTLNWENEELCKKAVERLIIEGKLMDALALSDRFLRDGASDHLLKLIIECEEQSSNPQEGGSTNRNSNSWQYCLRLRDKHLAAELVIKYLQRWELDAALDLLNMCSCHLSSSDPLKNKVLTKRAYLVCFSHILSADNQFCTWQQVEAECTRDPEGLALRLASKGAVSAALEVAESASLSVELRRELQGRQLVKLLTADPLSGGGPAEASRFLSSLCDSADALPVAISAMQLLPDLRSKQLLVHFFLKRKDGNLSASEVSRLNSWALGLRVLASLPLPWQQKCSSLHEYPHLILEVLLMKKQLQSAAQILKEFPQLRDRSIIASYAAKSIAACITSPSKDARAAFPYAKSKSSVRSGMTTRQAQSSSLSNLNKEARRPFSWASRNYGDKVTSQSARRKRRTSDNSDWETTDGFSEFVAFSDPVDGREQLPSVVLAEERILTGDKKKDESIRASHRFAGAPDIVLFKALLSLYFDDFAAAKVSLDLCINQMKCSLTSQQLPNNASMEIIGQSYYAVEAILQGLSYAKSLLKTLNNGAYEISSSVERNRDNEDKSLGAWNSSSGGPAGDELSELMSQVDLWLSRAELLQSLLGSGIAASLDDIANGESASRLCERLVREERYSMAVYTSRKCKIDVFPVWNAWGKALIRMERYAQARIKFKQAFQLYKGDLVDVIGEIINAIEGSPQVDVASARSMYEHLAKSAPTILDDSLSADSYLNVLYMPSTFPRSERSRRSQVSSSNNSNINDVPSSNLDSVRYNECVYYLQEYLRPQLLGFMFRHGHFVDACLLLFPIGSTSPLSSSVSSSTSLKSDTLATEYGTIDDLCELCVGYGAVSVLEEITSSRMNFSMDASHQQHIATALARICSYCESHKLFNYLYKFQVIKNDHVDAGLTCIQLFMNSSSQEEAVKHLERAKMHFDEGLSARYKNGGSTKLLTKGARGKSASAKLTEEGLVKFSARVSIQMEVVKSSNESDKPLWQQSLFGNPNDPDTFKRRCRIAESLVEKNFDLAFQVIYEFNLPAVDIYAAVAASQADRKKGNQLTEFFRNIKGTIDDNDWDQVLGAAINVYANKHKERPDRLIDMLTSSHRKVLACVVSGRLKSAFQIASRSGSVADVQYVAHQALHANALPVLDMCKQWLSQYM